MNFRQRFLRFGIGVFIGLLLSAFFFSGRGCNDWLPAKRIKARMQMDGIKFSESLNCWASCSDLPQHTQSTWMQWFMDAEINWSKSEPRQEEPCYWLDLPEESEFASVVVCFGTDGGVVGQAVLRESWQSQVTCPCDDISDDIN